MIIPVLLTAVLVFHDLPSVLSAEGDSCVTPNSENAICIKVNSCEVIVKAIQTRAMEAIQFARKSQCGYSGTVPLVCCGSTGLPTSSQIYQHPLLPITDECGLEFTSDRIVYHGETTELLEAPWAAMLGYIKHGEDSIVFSCGGSLINVRYVLTAGHCITPRDRKLTSVRLGEHNTTTNIDCEDVLYNQICNPAAVDYGIESAITHPSYVSKRRINDIALIRLNQDVKFQEHILPICLPKESTAHLVGASLKVVGWGETETASDSEVKRKAELLVISQAECQQIYGEQANISDYQYCAGGVCKNFRQCGDSCNGDSGGPSVRRDDSGLRWIQEGITSFGVKVCGQNHPAVYTRVSKYVKWIVDNMQA